MKKLVVLLLVLAFSASPLLAQEQPAAAPAAEAQPAVVAETQVALKVGGLTDESASEKVKQAVLSLDGVKATAIDLAQGIVTVTYDSAKLTVDQISEAINYTQHKVESVL